MIADSVAFLKKNGQGGRLRRRALLRRLPRRPRLRAARGGGGGRGGRRLGRAVRHQRRQPARAGSREVVRRGAARRSQARRSASTPTTTASWRWPTRWPRSRPAARRCRAPSTATASAAATPTSSPSSPPCSSRWATRCVADGEPRPAHRALAHRLRDREPATPIPHAPYVGVSAFAHKGGVHVAAVEKVAASYEHIAARAGGQPRKVVVSELSGRGQRARARGRAGPGRCAGSEAAVLARVKELENQGYQFEAAEGSFELLVRRSRPGYRAALRAAGRGGDRRSSARGTARCWPRPRSSCAWAARSVHTAAEGDGPVHALDRALRKALRAALPEPAPTCAWPTTRCASSTPSRPPARRRAC